MLRRPRAAGSVSLAAVLAACAACTQTTDGAAGARSAAPAAPRTVLTAEGEPVAFTEVDGAHEAGSDDYSTVGVIAATEPGEIYNVLAVDGRGRVLVDHTSESAYDPATNRMREPGAVELWHDGALTGLGSTTALVEGDAPRQSYGGELTTSDAVWVETESADVVTSDWRIFRRELRGTGGPELVATSEDVTGQDDLPIVVGDTRPVVSNERIYWKTAYLHDDGTYRTRLVSAGLGGGAVRDELDLTGDPQPVVDGVVVFRMADGTTEGTGSSARAQDPRSVAAVVLVRPDGSTRELLTFSSDTDDGWYPSGLTASGKIYAFALADAVHVLSTDGRTAVRIPAAGDPGASALRIGDLSVCAERVVWALRDQASAAVRRMVYDVASGELSSVGTPGSFGGTHCGGDYIAWGRAGADGRDETAVMRWR